MKVSPTQINEFGLRKICPKNKPELNVCHNIMLDQQPSMVLIFNLTSLLRAVWYMQFPSPSIPNVPLTTPQTDFNANASQRHKFGTDLLSGIKETMVCLLQKIHIGWKEKANNCQMIPIGLKVIFCFFQTSFKSPRICFKVINFPCSHLVELCSQLALIHNFTFCL